MSNHNLFTIYAKRFYRGKEVERHVLGHALGVEHYKISSECIRDHAIEQNIDVMFNMRMMLNKTGQVAKQFKRGAYKTCWIYFVQSEKEPNIDSGFTAPPEF